jgi:hypothetical protein
MGMQYDVKSKHISLSGVAYTSRTRLKGAIVSADTTAAARNTVFADYTPQLGTYSISTTTGTITIANTLTAGDRVWLDFTSGSGVDNVYIVVSANSTSFTITSPSLTTSGNVTMYPTILMEADSYNPTAFNVLIPGEGILAENGIYVGLSANVTTTIFYG